MQARDRLIVAFDGDWTLDEISERATQLGGRIGMAKIGKRLFTRHGPAAVHALTKAGVPVFLDLKFHDIPNTVAQAVGEAVALGVRMLNVHASGGYEMMRRAGEAAAESSQRLGVVPPILIAVTVLTSLDHDALKALGIAADPQEQVLRLCHLTQSAGLDGVVASAREVSSIRSELGEEFQVVTPGIRPAGASADDQKRVVTPAQAIASGADYIVVGRPIIGAPDPAAAADRIVAEMEGR